MSKTPTTLDVELTITTEVLVAGATSTLTTEQLRDAAIELARQAGPTETHRVTSELAQDLTPDAMRALSQQLDRQLDDMTEARAQPRPRLIRRPR